MRRMIARNEIVICQDPGIKDMYLCRSLRDQNSSINIVVEVYEMTAYPIQHPIIHKDVADEHPPLMPGDKVLLQFVSRVTGFQPLSVSETGAPPRMKMVTEQEYRLMVGSSFYWMTFEKCLNEYEERIRKAIVFQERHPSLARNQGLLVDPRELEILERHRKREFTGRRSVLRA